jgi:dTDP-4-dehydrorhamnose 3,5-epimerase
LVRVVSGEVLDVVVDIRPESQTRGKHFPILLSAENKKQLWIPEGFAHGFVTLSETALFAYKCTAFYDKECERGILWNDADLGINWGVTAPVLSDKDRVQPSFKSALDEYQNLV